MGRATASPTRVRPFGGQVDTVTWCAAAAGADPDDEPEVADSARVVSMAGYLSRRVGARGPIPLGPGYDPFAGFGDG